jgi:hypothetical protein
VPTPPVEHPSGYSNQYLFVLHHRYYDEAQLEYEFSHPAGKYLSITGLPGAIKESELDILDNVCSGKNSNSTQCEMQISAMPIQCNATLWSMQWRIVKSE